MAPIRLSIVLIAFLIYGLIEITNIQSSYFKATNNWFNNNGTSIINGVDYSLIKTDNCTYESERLNLVETSTQIVLKINDYTQSDSLIIRIGVDEDDLFGGF